MRTIRGKLLLGIGGLSAATVLLAGTLVAGLGRYSKLADHISARATRLTPASQLARAVDRAQNANRRWCDSIANQGMIDTGGLLGPPATAVARAGLAEAMLDLQIATGRYARSLPQGDRSIEPLSELIDAIDHSISNPSMMSVDPATRDNLLSLRLQNARRFDPKPPHAAAPIDRRGHRRRPRRRSDRRADRRGRLRHRLGRCPGADRLPADRRHRAVQIARRRLPPDRRRTAVRHAAGPVPRRRAGRDGRRDEPDDRPVPVHLSVAADGQRVAQPSGPRPE